MSQAYKRVPDQRWQALFPTVAALHEEVDSWPVGPSVADGVARLLNFARNLLVDSYFAFQYTQVAGEKALQALEACLRGCLPVTDEDADNRTLSTLIREGRQCGLLKSEEADVLQSSTRPLRNELAHGRVICPEDSEQAYGPEAALDLVRSAHEAVTDLYARAVASRDDMPEAVLL
ncbi:MAG TPA: hypothetical protein VGX23_05365 [Actinocrinis sp.]|nr:hypothetical protein [Actinocrinis sp.]